MNHFNFFENVQKEKKPMNTAVISFMLIGLTLCFLLGSYLLLKGRLSTVNNDLAYLERVQNDPAFKRQYKQETDLQKKVDKAEADYSFLAAADWAVGNGSTVSRELVEELIACMGRNAKVIKMSVSGSELTVEGLAKDLQTLIDVESNLNLCGRFEKVFVSSAKEDTHTDENGDEAVTFSCRMNIIRKETEEAQ